MLADSFAKHVFLDVCLFGLHLHHIFTKRVSFVQILAADVYGG